MRKNNWMKQSKNNKTKKEGEEENILHYSWQNFTGNSIKTIALNQVKINVVENLRGLSLRKKIHLMILIDVSVFLYTVFICICIGTSSKQDYSLWGNTVSRWEITFS